jgi:hypothetical protein
MGLVTLPRLGDYPVPRALLNASTLEYLMSRLATLLAEEGITSKNAGFRDRLGVASSNEVSISAWVEADGKTLTVELVDNNTGYNVGALHGQTHILKSWSSPIDARALASNIKEAFQNSMTGRTIRPSGFRWEDRDRSKGVSAKVAKKVLEERGLLGGRMATQKSAIYIRRGRMQLEDCELEDIIQFAQQWAKLGSMVQEQMADLILKGDYDFNPSALEKAAENLGGFHSELDDIFDLGAREVGL